MSLLHLAATLTVLAACLYGIHVEVHEERVQSFRVGWCW